MGIFEAIMVISAVIVGAAVGIILLGAIFDGVQKRAYNNRKKWDKSD
jgi:hypothetical protein